jgi:uncharacterized protein
MKNRGWRMSSPLIYWKDLYRKLKHQAVCIDIERTSFNGPISVIGWYEPKDRLIECSYFIRGQNLTVENLRRTFKNYRLIITYNGRNYDIPAIEKQFPGVFPDDVRILDLYILAKKLGISTRLKVLENSLNVERADMSNIKRINPVRLWQRYEKHGDTNALMRLLEYNKQDVTNLYPLAERLTSFIGDQPTLFFNQ